MIDYQIDHKPHPDEYYNAILDEYWKLSGGEFLYTPKLIYEKYNISVKELNRLNKEYSDCFVTHGICNCKSEIKTKVYSQTAFNYETSERCIRERCKKCQEDYNIRRPAELAREQEKQWEQKVMEMPPDELEILKSIVKLKDKMLIYAEVFNGNPYDSSIWRKVENIERTGLLIIGRTFDKRVVKFHFPEHLEYLLFK